MYDNDDNDDDAKNVIRYIVTGRAAHARIGRLFRSLLEKEGGWSSSSSEEGEGGGGVVSWVGLSPHAEAASSSSSSSSSSSRVGEGDRDGGSGGSDGGAGGGDGDDDDYDASTRDDGNDIASDDDDHGGGGGGGNAKDVAIAIPPAATTAMIETTTRDDDDDDDRGIDFLWENAPRCETRNFRDVAGCYSHLPFGMLLDDKWAMARLMGGGSVGLLRGWGGGGGCRGGNAAAAAAAATTRGGGGSATEGGSSIPMLQGGRTGIGKGGGAGSSSGDDSSHHRDHYLATLESHCFRGSDGFAVFAGRVGLLPPNDAAAHGSCEDRRACGADNDRYLPHCRFEDLLSRSSSSSTTTTTTTPPMPSNLWVIKDANSNGAGGIWIVDESNVRDFVPPPNLSGDRDAMGGVRDDDADAPTMPRTTPMMPTPPTPMLNPNHRYVAQRYAWPPTLYSGRKCHVRAYALLTCDGRAYLHRRAFLHVANEPFAYDNNADGATAANGGGGGAVRAARKNTEGGTAVAFDPSVHITNCCANSHHATKFTGEICVDLERMPSPCPSCPRGIHSRSHLDNDGSNNDDYKYSTHASFIGNDRNRHDELSSSHSTSKSPPLPLGEYLPSISASVASLASSFGPFLGGGEANRGFEYLGLDFVLSSVEVEGEGDERYGGNDNDGDHDGIGCRDRSNGDSSKSSSTERRPCRRLPVAYLLEANAPPSQDTATGLLHAESLHDEVVTDLLRMWVLPNVVADSSQTTRNDDVGDDVFSRSHSRRDCGGWRCVYVPPESTTAASAIDSRERSPILPSKAAILNRIRWALFENRASKQYEMLWNKIDDNKDESDNQQSTGASTLSTSLSALLPGGGRLNTQEDGKDVTLADQFCESSSSGEKDVVSFSFSHHHTDEFVSFVRSQFPYYSTATAANYVDNTTRIGSITSSSATTARSTNAIFFESGGGAQVPKLVVDAVASSLGCRDRSVIGRNLEKEARLALSSLLVNKINYSTESFECIDDDDNFEDDGSHVVIMGSNATSLLDLLARRMYESGILYQGDEIVISSENHLANVTPWLDLAAKIVGGVTVKWWTVVGNPTATNEMAKKNDHRTKDQNYCAAESSSCILSELITDRTRIVAISHVSNVLGMERDVPAICDLVHRITKGRGHVVVDGVAAAPHLLSSKAINATKIGGQGTPEWYIVSLHKFFGPHFGCLIGRRSAVVQMTTHAVNDTVCTEGKGVETDAAASSLSNEALAKSWERGTMNYEACSGSIALLNYAEKIGMKAYESFDTTCSSRQTSNQVTSESSDVPTSSSLYVNIASTCVQYVEDRLVCRLLGYLQSCTPLVRIIQDVGDMKVSKDPHGNGSINLRRVPTVCFFHASISSQAIVEHCRRHGVVCRACKFLSTDRLWDELLIGEDVNVVRFSLAHYNTPEEIDASFRILEMLEGWH